MDPVGITLAIAAAAAGLAYWRHMRARDRIERADEQTAADMDRRRRDVAERIDNAVQEGWR